MKIMDELLVSLALFLALVTVEDARADYLWDAQLCMEEQWPEQRAIVEGSMNWLRVVNQLEASQWHDPQRYNQLGSDLVAVVCERPYHTGMEIEGALQPLVDKEGAK